MEEPQQTVSATTPPPSRMGLVMQSVVAGVVAPLREGAAGLVQAPGNLGQAALAALRGDMATARAEMAQFNDNAGHLLQGLDALPLGDGVQLIVAGGEGLREAISERNLGAGLRAGVESLPYYGLYQRAEDSVSLLRPGMADTMRQARESLLDRFHTPVTAQPGEAAMPESAPGFGVVRERENGPRTPQ